MSGSPRRLAWGLVIALGAWGCSPIPPPAVLSEMDRTSAAPASVQAKALAPAAFEHAEKLRQAAHAAWEEGEYGVADRTAQQALAAYERAVALARLARAEDQLIQAEAARGEAEEELGTLSAEQGRLSAELASAEKELQTALELAVPGPSGPASPERERARKDAAKALYADARLLCASARLLVAGLEESQRAAVEQRLSEMDQALAELESDLSSKVAPIDAASQLRARCLSVLTDARDARTPVATSPGAGDALLAALSKAGHQPSRDDRGVYVVISDAYAQATLTDKAQATLAELARVAKAHPGFPVVVAVHAAKPDRPDATTAATLGSLAARPFEDAGVAVASVDARDRLPLYDPSSSSASKNARLDVVFVVPELY